MSCDSVWEKRHDPENIDKGEFLGTLYGVDLWSGVPGDTMKMMTFKTDFLLPKPRKPNDSGALTIENINPKPSLFGRFLSTVGLS